METHDRQGGGVMIEHVRDFRRVKKLAGWDVRISSRTAYLVDSEDGKDIGIWMFTPCDDVLSVHANMQVKGARAAKSAREAFRWIFEHTDWESIFAVIPSDLRHVQAMACHVGMEFYAVDDDGDRCYFIRRADMMSEAA